MKTLAELREIAEKATQDPEAWTWIPPDEWGTNQGKFGTVCDFGIATDYYPTASLPPEEPDAQHIATFSPATVLKMIAWMERAKEELLDYAMNVAALTAMHSLEVQKEAIQKREILLKLLEELEGM